jgi:ATP-binding cassette subfamily B protein
VPAARTLVRTLGLAVAADPRRAAGLALLTVALGLAPPVRAWLIKLVLDDVGAVAAGTAGAARPAPAAADAALAAALACAAVWVAGRLAEPARDHLHGNLATRVTGYVERRMMAVGGAIPDLDHFARKAFLDEMDILSNAVTWRPMSLFSTLHAVARSLITAAGALVLLWRFQPLLALGLIAFAVPQALAEQRLQQRTYQAITARSEKARMMAYCASVVTGPEAAKEVLVFGVGGWFLARWRRLSDEALAEMGRVRRAGLLTSLALVAGNGLALGSGFAYVASQVAAHRLSVGDLALFLGLVVGLQQAMFTVATGSGGLYGAILFMRRLFGFLDETRPHIAVAPAGQGLPAPARFRRGLELRRVSFTYPEQAEPVLRDVSCTIRAGETVALVGENGAGKTTLVKLLTRLYDPTDGELLLDGLPLRDYDLAGLRRRIAVLFQDFARFSLSAQHNIGVGDAPHADDRERVLAAAGWAGADAVLAKLPGGLETPLTRSFEGGVELSGGEWQKVATARAAMRDAALVILDEPTAALDAQAEYELFQRFRELAAGRTVLLISHRFSTVRMADRILVLERGAIVESGSHAQLVAQGGRYAALFEMQAGRYR